jgi:ubiquinone/menaquinone biosynthesis C-methylase UbiE
MYYLRSGNGVLPQEESEEMATSSAIRLATQHQEYFDQLSSSWDRETTVEGVECLSNIVKELSIRPGSHVLDIGSGTGILLPLLIEAVGDKGRIIALDFSQNMLKQAKAKGFQPIVHLVQADVTAIPLSNNLADLAICNNTFPHFNNRAKALGEMARILKDNGRLVICHTMSRDTINQLHQSIGGVVGADLLPDESQMSELIKHVGLTITCLEDSPKRYLVIAKKVIRIPN